LTLTARKAVVALALATAGVGAGIGMANAQTPPATPPTTVAPDDGRSPDAPAPPEDRENCPHKDGAGRGPGHRHGPRPDAGTGGAASQT